MAEIDIAILADTLDPAAELAGLTGRHASAGGIASFTGQVRTEPGLVALEVEHYPGVTEKTLDRIARTAAKRWPLSAATIRHRVGRMEIGAPIVFVAACAPHRREALEAVGYMIDMLKTRAPFWKQAHTETGSYWIEAVEADAAASEYWMDQMTSEDA
jgi:molybdopterin synthase catalytic subunit